jgi:hypothetical protein
MSGDWQRAKLMGRRDELVETLDQFYRLPKRPTRVINHLESRLALVEKLLARRPRTETETS